MTARLAVGVVFSARPWRAELQRYVRDHVVGVSLRLVRDPRVGLEEAMDVMVVDDEASFLTPAYVGNLRARGVRIVGVYDPASPDYHGRAHLERRRGSQARSGTRRRGRVPGCCRRRHGGGALCRSSSGASDSGVATLRRT